MQIHWPDIPRWFCLHLPRYMQSSTSANILLCDSPRGCRRQHKHTPHNYAVQISKLTEDATTTQCTSLSVSGLVSIYNVTIYEEARPWSTDSITHTALFQLLILFQQFPEFTQKKKVSAIFLRSLPDWFVLNLEETVFHSLNVPLSLQLDRQLCGRSLSLVSSLFLIIHPLDLLFVLLTWKEMKVKTPQTL